MVRAEVSLLQRMRPRPRLRASLTALVLMLVVGLIAAPAWSALRNDCSLCPPTCPMHHPRKKPAAASPHLNCHGVAKAAHHHADEQKSQVPKVGRPPCGNHGVSANILPPVILTARPLARVTPIDQSVPPLGACWSNRLADPPDTPPPITTA